MATYHDPRFSQYSGAPSIHPSIAPTFSTQATSHRSSTAMMNAKRASTASYLAPTTGSEKSSPSVYKTSTSSDATITASTVTLPASDPRAADLQSWSGALERMQDSRLDRQRYVLSPNKSEEVSKLALGAKVERALSRRMSGQDASFSSKKSSYNEKCGLEVKAN